MKFSRLKVGWLDTYIYIYDIYIYIIHPACFPMEGMVKSSFVDYPCSIGLIYQVSYRASVAKVG